MIYNNDMGMSKQSTKKQKKWAKPQLLILGRGKPEENVLAGCKLNGGGMKGPQAGNCAQPAPGCVVITAS
jgi:hypothetical protein